MKRSERTSNGEDDFHDLITEFAGILSGYGATTADIAIAFGQLIKAIATAHSTVEGQNAKPLDRKAIRDELSRMLAHPEKLRSWFDSLTKESGFDTLDRLLGEIQGLEDIELPPENKRLIELLREVIVKKLRNQDF